jgi:hypothetical protein
MKTASSPDDSQQTLARLRGVRVAFSAAPAEIRPFGAGATLTWTIVPPEGGGAAIFRLNGSVITLKGVIANAPDPDLDIEGVLGLGVEDGAVHVFFRRFSVDLDSPRWFALASAGLSKIAEQPMEALITDNLKPMLLRKAEDMIESQLRMIPPGFRLYRIDSGPDELTVIVCPSEPSP